MAEVATVLYPLVAVLHSNKLERLAELCVAWMRRHPLAPLEDEVVLVQSMGMGQWLKQVIAEREGLGVAMALRVELPSTWLWDGYTAVLGEDQVPKQQPLRKPAMLWRIFRLLPALSAEPAYAPLRRYLEGDRRAQKRYQLAATLADLFDQYQVYRGDWLQAWEQGQGCILDAQHQARELAPQDAWQPALWRRLLEDVERGGSGASGATDPSARLSSRAAVHTAFLAALHRLAQRPERLPRRIVVFGCASLSQQALEALHALGRFCQVLLCVHNPCRYFWLDILDGRQALRARFRRQAPKSSHPTELPLEAVHDHANPLLASWGRQGRDLMGLLDRFDDPQRYQAGLLQGERVELFSDYVDPEDKAPALLAQVQQAVLDLVPLPPPGAPRGRVLATDTSIAFHVAHSPLREVEVLHDRLLQLFAAGERAGAPLLPREIVVMVPDIDRYAPYIAAVFGQHAGDREDGPIRRDARYIPYSVADQRERSWDPVIIALEALLGLTESRLAASEVLQLFDIVPLRRRFGIQDDQLQGVARLVAAGSIRWGLDGRHRAEVADIAAGVEGNTWKRGLQRLMLGYALGEEEGDLTAEGDIAGLAALGAQVLEPVPLPGRGEAAVLGRVTRLLRALESLRACLAGDRDLQGWTELFGRLLDDFFLVETDAERLTMTRLRRALMALAQLAAEAAIVEPLPAAVAAAEWLAALERGGGTQRFLGGRVCFATLMPMRAIPFRVVCLMGLNDGDFPRQQPRQAFDLMARPPGDGRPGDRSRRQDDQYLFLEALLAARQHLHISWVGRSSRDDARRPASVLVEQLRDYLRAGWELVSPSLEEVSARLPGAASLDLLDALTWEHPLQPFSERYFQGNPRWMSFAAEWREARARAGLQALPATSQVLRPGPGLTLTPDDAARLLKSPARRFFQVTLGVRFEEVAETPDCEAFVQDTLERHMLREELLEQLRRVTHAQTAAAWPQALIDACRARALRSGRLPLAGFGEHAFDATVDAVRRAWERARALERKLGLVLAAPLEVARDVEVVVPEPSSAERAAAPAAEEAVATRVGVRVEGRLERWLQPSSVDGSDGRCCALELVPKPLGSGSTLKYRDLLAPWAKHLIACACMPAGQRWTTWVVGTDGSCKLQHVDDAALHLAALVRAYVLASVEPLCLGVRVGFAWLSLAKELPPGGEQPLEWMREQALEPDGAVAKALEADLEHDAYLRRAYPSIDELLAQRATPWAGSTCLPVLAEALYRPLCTHLREEP